VVSVAIGFGAGLLFGTGLVVARMTDPAIVLGFLDVTGAWNPSLLAVMAGAATTFGAIYARTISRQSPLAATDLRIPVERPLDRRLFVGTTLFGIGWGLVGLCPGPAVAALFGSNASGWAFVVAMLAGIAVGTRSSAAGTHSNVPSTQPERTLPSTGERHAG
jgi:uncharacterized membrane protein YedE/YeeE